MLYGLERLLGMGLFSPVAFTSTIDPNYRAPRTTTYFPDGLNGPRAVARRLRQIERGSLTVANGLVRS